MTATVTYHPRLAEGCDRIIERDRIANIAAERIEAARPETPAAVAQRYYPQLAAMALGTTLAVLTAFVFNSVL